ncbi:SMI1/KNR4 family protein [Actinomadura rugatobispora]|uniref:SMI1/KNR4 family protein n=1 Tax=Actinomadura rugatobispora TaxID=1994 RepID=A0ABW0ZRX7_9ACTN|nr:SMI1/KNR4 family protein [Actinomadura rugatobispora]
MSSIYDFVTWKPLLRLLRAAHAEKAGASGGHVGGWVDRAGNRRLLDARRISSSGQGTRAEEEAVEQVRTALEDAGLVAVSFVAEIWPDGRRTVIHLLPPDLAAYTDIGELPGTLVLVENSAPEPWRRLPDPMPDAAPAPSADPELLERTLRERLPDAIGATQEELDAAQERLGVPLPDELTVLYRATRANWEDYGDVQAADRECEAVGCELFPLEEVYVADAASRPFEWKSAATKAVVTPPGSAVQGLAGSPGWIVFGDSGGGDLIAVDLTPGPGGHLGQIIWLDHEKAIGADLRAESLTDMVVNRRDQWLTGPHGNGPGVVAHVNGGHLPDVEAAAHPRLEVLSIGPRDRPLSLAPVIGLPRLRTLCAAAGSLTDPLEITRLDALEFLELAPDQWRVLLDADAVPRSLLAARIEVNTRSKPDLFPLTALAAEIFALWDRSPYSQTTIEGHLDPMP